jgi:hydrogenase expression/formation protein HypC
MRVKIDVCVSAIGVRSRRILDGRDGSAEAVRRPRRAIPDVPQAPRSSERSAAAVCLAIPGQIVELAPAADGLAVVAVAGVRRTVNVSLLEDPRPGDWVLIHVGFALQIVDEQEAQATLRLLEQMGGDYEQELDGLRTSAIE